MGLKTFQRSNHRYAFRIKIKSVLPLLILGKVSAVDFLGVRHQGGIFPHGSSEFGIAKRDRENVSGGNHPRLVGRRATTGPRDGTSKDMFAKRRTRWGPRPPRGSRTVTHRLPSVSLPQRSTAGSWTQGSRGPDGRPRMHAPCRSR